MKILSKIEDALLSFIGLLLLFWMVVEWELFGGDE